MELKQKGTKADIGSFKKIDISLIWSAAVDLDLMAFYRTRDGRTGGVYSDNYQGGTLGALDAFPYIRLSGDAGVGGAGGANREDMSLSRIDDFEEIYICALNFTDAVSGQSRVFADYDARIQVATDRGETHTVPLDSTLPGPVAVICRFASGFIASELVNDSRVMHLDAFRAEIPGADTLKIASKVTLREKGDSFAIKQKVDRGELLINLNWDQTAPVEKKTGFFSKLMGGKTAGGVDLDLGCLFELQNQTKGAIQPLGKNFGDFDYPPYVLHLGDDRSGACSEGENMKVNLAQAGQLKRILIYTYIYEGVPNWTATNAVVTLTVPGQPILEVPMGSQTDSRNFCAIAMIEFGGGEIKVTKLVSFHQGHPDCDKTYGWGLKWTAGRKD
ncbi:stress response protein [Desulfococcus sp.]|uniref:TerD family protein n=1 Tax=Desulfococcus sp. TaxID=2025834 RepID=UPI003593B3A9